MGTDNIQSMFEKSAAIYMKSLSLTMVLSNIFTKLLRP